MERQYVTAAMVIAVNFLLLLAVNHLTGLPVKTVRLLSAAILGGAYSGLCAFFFPSLLGKSIGRLCFIILPAVTAFGVSRHALKQVGLFLLLSLSLWGVAAVFAVSRLPVLAVTSILLWVVWRIVFSTFGNGEKYIPLTIRYCGRQVTLLALKDTGNRLKDPVTGEQVIIIGPAVAEKLTGLTRECLANPVETIRINPIPGLRLIPYSSIGNKGGLMLGLRFKDVVVGQKKQSRIVAMAAEGMGDCDALAGGDYCA